MEPIPDIFVAGTDTGIGKSVVSLLVMQLLYAEGHRPFYLKPFQTGCADAYDADSDAAFVYRHHKSLSGLDPAQSVIYCYPNPKAPFFAARDAGGAVDVGTVLDVADQKRSGYAPLVVEGAGGLMVPVTADLLLVDVIRMLDCRPLLVARAGLGTINHTLLSIEAMRRREIEPLGIVLVESIPSATDPALAAENIEAVERLSGVTVGGVIPYLSDLSSPPKQAYDSLSGILLGP